MTAAKPAAGETEESEAEPSTGPFQLSTAVLIRPALELAWLVARTGEVATPPVPAPGPIRKLLRFSKLPDRALATLRRVVEDDADFRARVAEAADEEAIGRPSFLWLARPDGWEDELGRLDAEAVRSAATAEEQQEERSARRRLTAAEEAKRRAEASASAATAVANRANEELTSERQARRAAEARAGSLSARVTQLEAQVAVLDARAESAEQARARLGQAEAALVAERDRLRERVEALEARLADAAPRLEEYAAGPEARPESDAAAGLADAAVAARQLGDALEAASEALAGRATRPGGAPGALTAVGSTPPSPPSPLSPPSPPSPPSPHAPFSPHPPEVTSHSTPGPGRPSPSLQMGVLRPVPPERRPSPLPPAVFEDSPEAALHLLRVPSMMLLVDGYNVSLAAWPELPIPEQRRRLVDALAGLAARTGVDAQVVFDGAEQAEPRSGALAPRSAVRVRFSPPEVEADEVLIELIDVLPLNRPVTVATSDRRVQGEVRRRGANVISTAQLLAAMTGR